MRWTHTISMVNSDELKEKIQSKLDNLTKPQGSLGRLEDIVKKYCLCRNDVDATIDSAHMYVFAADHGITDEGVAPFPKEVTTQMVKNMINGGAAINVLCKNASIDCTVVDVGVDAEFEAYDRLINKKIGKGTKNFLNDSAMSSLECDAAIDCGYEIGYNSAASIIGIGEMGIGNTSSASALAALLLGIDARETVGMGTGALGPLLERKRNVISNAVDFHRKSWDETPVDALRRVGGFEIAAMTGAILGAASKRIPVVVDGFISTVAAMTAIKMCPHVTEYLYFAHVSNEMFHRSMLEKIGVQPLLDLGMRLGEGTGAVLAIQIIKQALNCYHQMATFTTAGVANRDD